MQKLTSLLFTLLLSALPLKDALALNCYLGGSGGPVEETKTISPFADTQQRSGWPKNMGV